MRFRLHRTLAGIAAAALLVPAIAACQPAATPTPTTGKPAAPTAAPAAKPTTAPAAKPAASPVASPATSPAASPAAKPAASPAASPAAKPAASPVASPAVKPAASPSPSPAASPAAQVYPKPSAPPKPTGTDLGSVANPIDMAFVPSQDSQKILASGEPIARLLEEATNLTFAVSVPTNYTTVIEGMGAGQVDVGWLAPFAYVLAEERDYADVILSSVRQGSKTYRSQIITHVDSGVNSLEDLRGKRFAFVDPASASGFLFPNALLAQNGIDFRTFFSETVFAGGHPQVVIAVYNQQVEAGATFGDSREGGPPTDARTNVVSTLPDVMDKVKVIARTDPIPNDTVSVRQDLDPQLRQLIRDGLLYVQSTPEGQQLLRALYNIDGLAPAEDNEYDSIRQAARALNLDLEEQIAPPKPKS